MPGAKEEQIEADGELAELLQAEEDKEVPSEEQVEADRIYAQKLQESTSVTHPRVWPNDSGARGSNDNGPNGISNGIQLPDPNDHEAHHQVRPGSNRRTKRRRSASPDTKLGHRIQLRYLLRLIVQFNFPIALTNHNLGSSLSKLTGSQRRTQLEAGQLINIVLDYALNFNYSVTCTARAWF